MNPSITAFERKYLAPKRKVQESNGYDDALFFIGIAFVTIVLLAFDQCIVPQMLAYLAPSIF